MGHFDECRYDECHYAECRGALTSIDRVKNFLLIFTHLKLSRIFYFNINLEKMLVNMSSKNKVANA